MKAPSLREKALCFRQLANLVQAAIPLNHTLTLLHAAEPSARLRPLLISLASDLQQGRSLSDAAKRHPKLFTSFAAELIQLGESTGQLSTCLLTLADTTDAELTSRQQLKQTLTYPAVIFTTSSLLLLSLFYWVIPRFAALYQTRTETLPALTRALFWSAEHCNTGLMLLFLSLFVLLGLHYWRRPTHPLMSTLPLLRTYWKRMEVLRFTQGLGLALSAGLPIDASLRLAGSLSTDPTLQGAIRDIRQQLHRGLPLHQAMKPHLSFPPLLTGLIQTGEATGRVESLLMHAHHQLNETMQYHLQQAASLLEPLILLSQGVLIGGIVIGLYLPIFNLGTLL